MNMRSFLCFLMVLALWLLLFVPDNTWATFGGGVVFALVVGLVVGKFYPAEPHKVLEPRRWVFALAYLPYFVWFVVRANLDVMVRVLHPNVPIRPGIVKVTTSLKTNLAKTFLANSITLMPGTHVVDILGSDIYVHWINVTTDDPQEQNAIILQHFEPLLRRIFE